MAADLAALQVLLAQEPVVLVQMHEVQGSGPREVGAWMAVAGSAVIGTVGGGRLEFDAIALAQRLLAQPPVERLLQRYPLGPSLGQCCGGVVTLSFEQLSASLVQRLAAGQSRQPVALFGGGHVGRAIVRLLADLPTQVLWVDSRDEIFPTGLPAQVRAEHSEPVQDAVRDVAPGSQVLIMSFSHAEDLDVLAACLLRQREKGDLSFIGLIGSKSKWAVFRHRLEARGFTAQELAGVTCPIGLPGIRGKQPEVIALAVVAQLLQAWPED